MEPLWRHLLKPLRDHLRGLVGRTANDGQHPHGGDDGQQAIDDPLDVPRAIATVATAPTQLELW